MQFIKTTRNSKKVLLWISIFVIGYVCIAITTDSPRFGTPVQIFDSYRSLFSPDFQYSQPSAKNQTTVSIFFELNTSQSATDVSGGVKNITTHVAFLKVHKTGSSTMANVLFRFGLRHNLNILLPKSGKYLFTPAQKIPLKPGEHYDIFACHTVYEKKWFDSLLPADSVTIGIVREPVSRMISSAYYYRDVFNYTYLKKIPEANFIHNLVNFPEKYNRKFFSRTRNSMGKDFGFQSHIQMTNKSLIRPYLNQLNSQFLLVLIMEKFDESLVLMKRLLNWSFIDIMYFKLNSHKHNPVVLNSTEMAKFRNTSFLDFEIYEYFADVFEKKLKQLGDEFYDEVAFFKTLLTEVSGFCLKENKSRTETLSLEQSKWDGKFQVWQSDCDLMQLRGFQFINKLRPKYLRSAPKGMRKVPRKRDRFKPETGSVSANRPVNQ